MTKYYINYYKAKADAEKHGLKECDYGDWDADISYCCWNKSGDRNDDAEIECYYIFEKQDDGRYRPQKIASESIFDWARAKVGLCRAEFEDGGDYEK